MNVIECCDCKEAKSADDFHRDSRRKTGRAAYCKPCTSLRAHRRYEGLDKQRQKQYAHDYYMRTRETRLAKQKERWAALPEDERKRISRERQIKHMYGITLVEYDEMFTTQNGVCAICAEPPETVLHVDHDHATGNVRGLLCSPCNTSLGGFRDNPTLLMAAVAYLEAQIGE